MIKMFSIKLKIVIFSLLAVAALLMAVASPAFAKAEDPIRDLSDLSRLQTKAISAAFKHDQALASSLARQINGASRKNGLNSNLALARAFLNYAQAMLDNHAGFDGSGNVLARNLAIATLTSVEYNLRNANYWVMRYKLGR